MIYDYEIDISLPILVTLISAADNSLDFLSDHDFKVIVEKYGLTEADEQEIMEQMINCKSCKFTRYSNGWSIHRYNTNLDEIRKHK